MKQKSVFLCRWSLVFTFWFLFPVFGQGFRRTQVLPEADSIGVRISLSPVPFDQGDTLHCRWHKGDSVRVWADSLAPVWFRLIEGAGSAEALFEGPALQEGVRYFASCPGPVPGDRLLASAVAGSGGVDFRLEHSAAFVRIHLTPLVGKEATALQLIPLHCEPPLLSLPLEPGETPVTLLQAVAPREWAAWDALAAMISYRDGSLGTVRLDAQPLRKGEGVDYTLTPILEDRSEKPSSLPVTMLPERRQWISHGQYSGITCLGDGRYAVVHDKSAGGGIHFFHITLDKNGYAVASSTCPAQGNGTLPEGQDNEGIVFLPGSQTLLISAEADQSIREYRLDGQPTGRSAAVPEDLLSTQPNAGFEALGYNAATGLLWTVTEKNLPDDEEGLLRLQSFDANSLQPASRYLYRCSPATVPPEQAEKATAYVLGVPAITALDDGRLLVMEREVYVPAGPIWDKARGALTRTAIYMVDPAHDPAGILGKELLARFTTGALNLANFEGMCLGPVQPDGRRPLILIADSQGGMHGLTGEYLKVIWLD